MKYLIYVSAAIKLFSEAELEELLKISRHNNVVDSITGILLYSEGTFMQVLEGPAETVVAAYARIEADYRHTGIITLAEGEINDRVFPNWSMGFKVVSANDFARFDAFIHPTDVHQILTGNQAPIQILKAFADTNF